MKISLLPGFLLIGTIFLAALNPEIAFAATPNPPILGPNTGNSAPPPQGDIGTNSYYEFLQSQNEAVYSAAFRSPADVQEFMFGDNPGSVFYNESLDATEWTFPGPDKGSYFHGQLRTSEPASRNFPHFTSGKVLTYWEVRWSDVWANEANYPGQQEHKMVQLGTGTRPDRRGVEIQMRPRTAGQEGWGAPPAGAAGRITMRIYNHTPGGQGTTDFPSLEQVYVYPGRWTRFWLEMDFDNDQISFWVGDPVQGIVQMYDRYQMSNLVEYQQFDWEWNASTERNSGPDLPTYGRNLVVLQNSNANSLVSSNSW